MRHHAFTNARHRLLEGFLARLAQEREADAFALRGGMLVRQWFPNIGRAASDVDLVCALPFDIADVRARMTKVLATPRDDGISFDSERVRLDTIWPDDAHPGMRLVAQAAVDGVFDEVHVDLTFSLPIFPRAVRGNGASLFECPPAMLIGRKLRVTSDLGRRFFRPKDLADLLLLLRHRKPPARALGESIERTFTPESDALRLVTNALAPSAWDSDYARARFGRFAAQRRLRGVPRDVRHVTYELRSLLQPVLRS